jgi:hypothetical protein
MPALEDYIPPVSEAREMPLDALALRLLAYLARDQVERPPRSLSIFAPEHANSCASARSW